MPELTAQPDAIAMLQLRDLESSLCKLELAQREVILLVGSRRDVVCVGSERPQRASRHGTLAPVARS